MFQRDWFLDIVAPGQWERVEVRSSDGELEAWLPYVVTVDRMGMRCIDMPGLTLSLGPWVREPRSGDPRRRLAHYTRLLGELVDQLPEAVLFRQSFHHSIPTALPFAHRGFSLHVAYTHIIDDPSDLDAAWKRISTSRRQDINKARRTVEVTTTDDLEVFLRLNQHTYARQGQDVPEDENWLREVDVQLAERGARTILVATDTHGNHHGAHYLLHDEDTTYGSMSGIDPEFRSSCAGSLLLWEAIESAGKARRSFNFNGGTLPRVYPFIASYGADLVPYVWVERESLRWRSMKLARDSTQRLVGAGPRLS